MKRVRVCGKVYINYGNVVLVAVMLVFAAPAFRTARRRVVVVRRRVGRAVRVLAAAVATAVPVDQRGVQQLLSLLLLRHDRQRRLALVRR